MVFDPLSIIGYAGTSMGLTGFLVSTITRLEQFSRDFGEAHEKLRWYNLQMSGANIEIQAWRRLWREEFPYTDQDYEYLWGTGPEGYPYIQRLLNTIRHEIDAIGLLMYGDPDDEELRDHTPVTDHDWTLWQKKLDDMSRKRNDYDPGDSWFKDLLNKLLFASYRGVNLEERIKRLRDKIQALTTDSQKLFIQTQFWLSGSHTADGDTVRRVNERRELMEERNRELRQFHSLSGGLGEWSLVLTLPPEGSGPNLIDEEARFCLKFVHQPAALTPPDARNPIFITFSTPRAFLRISDYALSMGISLAELALKQPITLNATGNEMIFHLNGSPKPTYEQQLLKLVKRRSTLGYKNAVIYRFLYDKALSQRKHEFHPQDVATMKERVLDPLVNYLNDIDSISA